MDTLDITLENDFVLQIPQKIGKYSIVRLIGTGSFSAVVLVRINSPTPNPISDSANDKTFACKVVSRVRLVQERNMNRFEQEIRILQSLHHPNIVHVEEIVYIEDYICIIMEYCEKGEIFNHIVQNGAFSEKDCIQIFKKIVEAVKYIHDHNIAHRDLKPENILLTDDNEPKLADFGLCHMTDPNILLKTPCGSPFYAPPEILNSQPYDGKKADMWSLGIVLFTMATGSLPWTQLSQTHLFKQIREADITIPTSLSISCQNLLKKLLVQDPSKRPTCEEVLQSQFFQFQKCPLNLHGCSDLHINVLMNCKSNSESDFDVKSQVYNKFSIQPASAAISASHSAFIPHDNYRFPIITRHRENIKGHTNEISSLDQSKDPFLRTSSRIPLKHIKTESILSPRTKLLRKVPSGRRKPR